MKRLWARPPTLTKDCTTSASSPALGPRATQASKFAPTDNHSAADQGGYNVRQDDGVKAGEA